VRAKLHDEVADCETGRCRVTEFSPVRSFLAPSNAFQ